MGGHFHAAKMILTLIATIVATAFAFACSLMLAVGGTLSRTDFVYAVVQGALWGTMGGVPLALGFASPGSFRNSFSLIVCLILMWAAVTSICFSVVLVGSASC